jgi:Flp pilus assembly pilin Flp
MRQFQRAIERLTLDRLTRSRGDTGASMVEYALLVGLIAVVCLVSLTGFVHAMSHTFTMTCQHVQSVQSGTEPGSGLSAASC